MIARGKRLVVAGVVAVILLIAISASAQIYRYYKPGSVFTLTLIKVNSEWMQLTCSISTLS